MTRAQLRAFLRRRLQEDTADQWTDDELNEILNVGLQRMQSAILRVHPEAFISIATAPIVVGTDLEDRYYKVPPGFWYETKLEQKNEDGDYATITRRPYSEALEAVEGETDPFYARHGQYLVLAPSPAAAVAAGLRITFVPTLSMSADADVPDIPASLHIGIVLWSHLLALPESGESGDQESVRKDLATLLAEIPLVYLVSAAAPSEFCPDIEKGY